MKVWLVGLALAGTVIGPLVVALSRCGGTHLKTDTAEVTVRCDVSTFEWADSNSKQSHRENSNARY